MAIQICDRCGAQFQSLYCKLTCDNCGARLDCSDLFIDWDQVQEKRRDRRTKNTWPEQPELTFKEREKFDHSD